MSSFASGYIKYIHHLEQINDSAIDNVEIMIAEIEESYHDHLKFIAKNIVSQKNTAKICMLAGPSSSGKTTTAHCLQEYLRELGVISYIVSLDDFYLNQELVPVAADGTKDFDTVDALDIDAIKNCIKKIVDREKIEIPNFNFVKGKAVGKPREFIINKNDLVIIEGIHALNPMFTEKINVDNLIKLYVSVKQPIKDENAVVMSPNDIRLIRRIVRDVRFRGCDAEGTLSMWDTVESGENKYIRPYRFTADYTVNSIHLYEPCVLRTLAIPMLRAIQRHSPYYSKARELEGKLMRFEPISPSYVPDNSILREFIGKEK